mmetsp:Transcript_51739/g.75728  ORF Transcript_51739/g.75728 Transcript_51739/m.75728 type:complete len:82 (+) Transcript_51739:306-551(+)
MQSSSGGVSSIVWSDQESLALSMSAVGNALSATVAGAWRARRVFIKRVVPSVAATDSLCAANDSLCCFLISASIVTSFSSL